jgi:hypothetical protein
MIKRIRKYFILSVVALLATSCLDKYPEDAMLADKAINTVDDANQAVIGIYDAFKSSSSNIKYIDNQLVTVIKIQMICKCKYKTI